jgi:replication-associated recombination protein RarA
MFGNSEHTLYVEKYRPDTLDGYVGNQAIVEKVRIYLQSGDVPHLLLYGTAGTGKCLGFEEPINVEIELSESEVSTLKKYIIK